MYNMPFLACLERLRWVAASRFHECIKGAQDSETIPSNLSLLFTDMKFTPVFAFLLAALVHTTGAAPIAETNSKISSLSEYVSLMNYNYRPRSSYESRRRQLRCIPR